MQALQADLAQQLVLLVKPRQREVEFVGSREGCRRQATADLRLIDFSTALGLVVAWRKLPIGMQEEIAPGADQRTDSKLLDVGLGRTNRESPAKLHSCGIQIGRSRLESAIDQPAFAEVEILVPTFLFQLMPNADSDCHLDVAGGRAFPDANDLQGQSDVVDVPGTPPRSDIRMRPDH